MNSKYCLAEDYTHVTFVLYQMWAHAIRGFFQPVLEPPFQEKDVEICRAVNYD